MVDGLCLSDVNVRVESGADVYDVDRRMEVYACLWEKGEETSCGWCVCV